MIESSADAEDSFVNRKPALITNDPLVVNSIIMHYQYLYGVLKIINKKAAESSVEASRLAARLNQEYHLDE
jgi:hypothetical protein